MMHRRALLSILVVACGGGDPGLRSARAELSTGAGERTWSVLVYMMADAPDLASYALWNLRQMEGRLTVPGDPAASAASGRDADIVVELDLDRPPGIRRLHVRGGDTAFAPLAAIEPGAEPGDAPRALDLTSPVVERLDEAAAEAPPATPASRLRDFLSWAAARYPARHYAVIVWGHGHGFRPSGTDGHWREHEALRGGLAPDASDHTVLDTPGLRDALAAMSSARLAGRPVDLYLSDACLMQTIEVAAELAGVARYIGGAEAKLTPLGLPYRLIAPALNGTSPLPASPRCAARDAACQLAVQLPALVRRGLDPQSALYASPDVASTARSELTYSVLDARLVAERLVPAMHRLGAALLGYLHEAPRQAAHAAALRNVVLPHRATFANPDPVHAFIGGGRDIGALLTRLRAELDRGPGAITPAGAAVLDAIDGAEAALRAAVVASALGDRYDDPSYAGMQGVSVWLPTSADDYRSSGGWFAAARSYRAPDGTAGDASPWGAWLSELFEDSTEGGAP